MEPIRTIIVDDSPEFIKVLQRTLKSSRHISLIAHAATGEEATALALKVEPDLIFMDLVLPGMNGVEAIRQIKARLPRAAAVLMTLYDFDEYRRQAAMVGIEEVVHKSELSKAWVDSLVERLMTKSRKFNILVVDDSPTIRRMVMAALRPLGAEFGEASTGLEAIEQLTLNEYHAMTLDLNMPDMHGLEVIDFLRSTERFRALPIVVLTTRSDDDSRERALAGGASHYFTKPFKPDELLMALKGLIPR